MKPRIAIPLPHGGDPEYALRAIPQYERAVELSGGQSVRIPLDRPPAEVMKMIEQCDGVLLPGSKADVDPAKFGAEKHAKTEAADPKRDTVDELLLQDAYNMRKPILGICYGLQSLNVYRSGTLVQHIPEFLPEAARERVNHEAGRNVAVAHSVEIAGDSKLAGIVKPEAGSRRGCDSESATRTTGASAPPTDKVVVPVNSSHHQSADAIGDTLRVVARCPDDDII